jgi:hypothetical protein
MRSRAPSWSLQAPSRIPRNVCSATSGVSLCFSHQQTSARTVFFLSNSSHALGRSLGRSLGGSVFLEFSPQCSCQSIRLSDYRHIRTANMSSYHRKPAGVIGGSSARATGGVTDERERVLGDIELAWSSRRECIGILFVINCFSFYSFLSKPSFWTLMLLTERNPPRSLF